MIKESQFSVQANHYGNDIFHKYNGDTVHTNCLISKNDQQAEVQYFEKLCMCLKNPIVNFE